VKPVVLILAAGKGERFRFAGGQTDKLNAVLHTPSGRQTVLDCVMAAARASGLPWHVVRPEHTAHRPEQGMGTSIATGVAATPDASGWLVLPGDLPLVQPDSIRAVALALERHDVVAPVVDGERGHPVGFGRCCQAGLLALRGDMGAKRLLAQHAVHLLPLNDVGCTLDVDTPERLAQAQVLWC